MGVFVGISQVLVVVLVASLRSYVICVATILSALLLKDDDARRAIYPLSATSESPPNHELHGAFITALQQ